MDERKLKRWLVMHDNEENVRWDSELPHFSRQISGGTAELCAFLLGKIQKGDFD